MKVIIFCGGDSMRFMHKSTSINKVMALINGKPLVWYIMNYYNKFNFKDFILCVKDEDLEIRNYFLNISENWNVVVLPSGNKTKTGKRLKKCEPYIKDDIFLATYGDGLSDINITQLIESHKKSNSLATLSAIKPINPYGVLEINSKDQIVDFKEKPLMDVWVNGGFFVFNKEIFQYLTEDLPLETGLLNNLSVKGNLNAFKHNGNWKSMDTYKDYVELCKIWENSKAFWL